LTLERLSQTLSGGESQRIQLASSLGGALTGTLYVLDEPSIGLHQRDTNRLLTILKRVRDLGNTVIVVEHDEDVIRTADHIVDFGPRAGKLGGEVVYAGSSDAFASLPKSMSLTAQYLDGKLAIPIPKKRRRLMPRETITVTGANENNLRNVNATFPLGV